MMWNAFHTWVNNRRTIRDFRPHMQEITLVEEDVPTELVTNLFKVQKHR